MSDSVGIVTSPPNPALQTGGSANAPATTSSASESFQAQAAQNPNASTSTPAVGASDSDTPISPRIVLDPFAGPITEVLSANGQIQAQFPSAAVVAYLRAGLTSSGLPKPTTEPTPQTENSNSPDKNSVVA